MQIMRKKIFSICGNIIIILLATVAWIRNLTSLIDIFAQPFSVVLLLLKIIIFFLMPVVVIRECKSLFKLFRNRKP